MGKHSDQRDRTLCLTRILYQQTDEHHPLTMQQLLHQLAQAGMTVERKSVYRDLAAMNKWGFSVAFRPGKQGGWYAVRRPLDPQQVQAAVDAVGAYPWLPEGLRASLLDRLAALCPRWQRGQFHRPVSLPPHRGRDPETVRRVLDRIYGACRAAGPCPFGRWTMCPAGAGRRRGRPVWSAPRRSFGSRSSIICWAGTTGTAAWGCTGWTGWKSRRSPACPPRGRRRRAGPISAPPLAWSPGGGSGCSCAVRPPWRRS